MGYLKFLFFLSCLSILALSPRQASAGDCSDFNPCTDDHYDNQTGQCRFTNNTLPCNDRSVCTVNDRCLMGRCRGIPRNCDDGNPCTDDSCRSGSGCAHKPVEESICDDGNSCTAKEECNTAGTCDGGVQITSCRNGDGCCPADCSAVDDSDCYPVCGNGVVEGNETCDPPSNCPSNRAACDDGNPCTTDNVIGFADNCSAQCVHGAQDGCAIDNPVEGGEPSDDGESDDPPSGCGTDCDDENPDTDDTGTPPVSEPADDNIPAELRPVIVPALIPFCTGYCEGCPKTAALHNKQLRDETGINHDLFSQCESSRMVFVCFFKNRGLQVDTIPVANSEPANWWLIQESGRRLDGKTAKWRDSTDTAIEGPRVLLSNPPVVEDEATGRLLFNDILTHDIIQVSPSTLSHAAALDTQFQENPLPPSDGSYYTGHMITVTLPCAATWTGTDGAPGDPHGIETLKHDIPAMTELMRQRAGEAGGRAELETTDVKGIWESNDVYKFTLMEETCGGPVKASITLLATPAYHESFNEGAGCGLLPPRNSNEIHPLFFLLLTALILICSKHMNFPLAAPHLSCDKN